MNVTRCNCRRCFFACVLCCILQFAAAPAQGQEAQGQEAQGQEAPSPGNDSGRSTFITATALLSGLYYGPALTESFHLKKEGGETALWLAMGGLGYLVPSLLTADDNISEGTATLAVHGGIRGIFDGWMLYKMAAGRDSAGEDFFADKAVLGAGVAGSVAELAAGYLIARNADMSPGAANLISTCGNLGLGFGCEAYGLMTTDEVDNVRYGGLFGSMLGCSALGYLAGSVLAGGSHYTKGDASVFSAAALLGAGLPPALATLTDAEDSRLYFGLSMAGCVGAALLADRFLASRDFTSSQGDYVGLGMLGGALAGWGLGFALTGDDDAEPNAPWTALGAAGGFALMLGLFSERASAAANPTSWYFQVNPAGLASALSPHAQQPRVQRPRTPVPLLGVSARL